MRNSLVIPCFVAFYSSASWFDDDVALIWPNSYDFTMRFSNADLVKNKILQYYGNPAMFIVEAAKIDNLRLWSSRVSLEIWKFC